MRDYDPTTGRYTQADPLGLVDGASVYGYALQNPGRYVDPRGEFGIIGGAIGGISSWGFQFAVNYYYYRDMRTSLRCIDYWKVFNGVVWGATGVNPRKLAQAGQLGNAAAALAITQTYGQNGQEIRAGSSCECEIPPDRRPSRFLDFVSNLFL